MIPPVHKERHYNQRRSKIIQEKRRMNCTSMNFIIKPGKAYRKSLYSFGILYSIDRFYDKIEYKVICVEAYYEL